MKIEIEASKTPSGHRTGRMEVAGERAITWEDATPQDVAYAIETELGHPSRGLRRGVSAPHDNAAWARARYRAQMARARDATPGRRKSSRPGTGRCASTR